MYTIAIIDDEKDIVDMVERALRKIEDIEIVKFTDPSRALEDAIHGRFDLVISDIMMPKLNGMDLLKVLKTNNPNVKIIMMTAFSTHEKMVDASDYGADDYLTKPFISLKDVEAKVKDALNMA